MASIYVRGGTWWISYLEHGKRVQRSLKTKSKSEAKLKKTAVEYKLANHKPVIGADPYFGPFALQFVDETAFRRTESSQDRVKRIIDNHLIPAFEWTQISQIDEDRAHGYRSERLLAGAANATIAKELRTLRSILAYAVKKKEISEHPLAHLELPKDKDDSAPPYYSQEQLSDLYAASNDVHREMWRFIVNTGIRRQEALDLKVKNVKDGLILIESTSTDPTKSGKSRKIHLNDAAQAACDFLISIAKCGYLFPQMHSASLTRAFKNDARRAGLPGSIHWLRHTACTHLLLNSVPPRVVQQIMGHSSLEVTLRYAKHVPDEALESAVSKIAL